MIIKQLKLDHYLYGNKKRLISLAEVCGEYEVGVFVDNESFDEIEIKRVKSFEEGCKLFDSMVEKYAGTIQSKIYNANLKSGERYTLVYVNEFGFPVAINVTMYKVEYSNYAQYDDAVRLIFKLKNKRSASGKFFYDQSLAIFKGWQTMPDSVMWREVSDSGVVKTRVSKYGAFDYSYFEDAIKYMKNPVMIHDGSKIGVNGKKYA